MVEMVGNSIAEILEWWKLKTWNGGTLDHFISKMVSAPLVFVPLRYNHIGEKWVGASSINTPTFDTPKILICS